MISKTLIVVGFLFVLLLEGALVLSIVPAGSDAIEKYGAALLLVGSGIWFAGLSLLLTERHRRFQVCALFTGISMPILVLAYALMMQW